MARSTFALALDSLAPVHPSRSHDRAGVAPPPTTTTPLSRAHNQHCAHVLLHLARHHACNLQARGSAAYQLGALLLLWTLYTHASNVRALVLGAADAVAAALALRPHLAGYAAAAAALLRICAALAYLAAGWALAAFVLPHALTRFRLPEVELEYARTVNSGSAALDGWAATACAALQLPAALSAFPNPLPTVGALLALAPAAVQWRCGHAAYAALREWLLLRMQLVLLALHVIGVASGDRTTGADIAFLVLPAVALSLACRVGAAVPIHLVALATYVLITTDGAAAGGGGGSSRGAGGAEAAAAAARSSDIAAESTAVFVATTLAWACDAARRFTFRAARLRSSSAAVTAADSDDLCAR